MFRKGCESALPGRLGAEVASNAVMLEPLSQRAKLGSCNPISQKMEETSVEAMPIAGSSKCHFWSWDHASLGEARKAVSWPPATPPGVISAQVPGSEESGNLS